MIAGLPYDAEVEYLESTGAQYIDTGVSAYNAVVGTEIKFQSTTTQNDKWVFGIYNNNLGNNYNYLIGSYGGWNVYLGSKGQLKPGYSVDMNEHIVRINIDGKTQFDNVVLLNEPTSMTYTGDSSSSLWIFATHRNGNRPTNNYYMTAKVFYCKIYRDGVLVRDYIPVRFTNSNGQSEGAMYDRVSRKLFRNKGTGSFVIGPDVVIPIMGLHFMRRPKLSARNYVQDGLVAMWDGIENAGWGQHDASATTWKDLVGNGDMSLTYGSMTFSESACVVTNGLLRTTLGQIATALNGKEITVEAVYVATGRGYPIIAPNSSPALNIWNNGGNNMLFNIFGSNIGDLGWTVTVRDSSTPPFSHLVYAVSESDGNSRGYLDGALKKTTTLPATLTTGYSTTQDFGLGNSSGSGMSFNGQMSALRFYSRALTAADIAHNYAIDKERFNLP